MRRLTDLSHAPVWRFIQALSAVFLLWRPAAGQILPYPEIRLNPGPELRLPFSSVEGLVELPDGSFLVADLREQALYRSNPDGTRKQPVGRNGRRAGEYLVPTRLLTLPGDSALLFDGAQSRYLLVRPDGTIGQTFSLQGEGVALVNRTPLATDNAGGIYFRTESMIQAGERMSGEAGRIFLLRYDRRNGRVSPITTVLGPPPPGLTPGAEFAPGEPQVAPDLPEPDPYRPEDAWGVAMDGRVAVGRVLNDRVEWYGAGGARMVGPPLRTQIRRVRVPDMRRWLRVWQDQRLAEGFPPSQVERVVIDDVDWPVNFPPFSGGMMPVDPFGNFWLLRSHPGDPEQAFDVMDGQGVVRARVILPGNTRLQAFGRNALYLVRTDALGLEWIQRVSWP